LRLALRLATQDRATRLAGLLVALGCSVPLLGEPASVEARQRTAIIGAALLAAVSGACVLARGAPLWSARRAAGPWLAPGIGRLAAVALIAGLAALAEAAVLFGGSPARAAAVAASALLGAGALGAATMPLGAVLGSSGAAGVGAVAALGGSIPPSAIATLLAPWPLVRTPVVLVWNVLPLPWRAQAMLTGNAASHGVWLCLWWAAGVLLAGWVAHRVDAPDGDR